MTDTEYKKPTLAELLKINRRERKREEIEHKRRKEKEEERERELLSKISNIPCVHSFKGHEKFIESFTISSDSKYLISGSRDRTVKIWDVESGEIIRTFSEHKEDVYFVEISPNQEYVISISSKYNNPITSNYPSTLKVWKFPTGEPIYSISISGYCLNYLCGISPKGNYFYGCAAFDSLKIWEYSTKNLLTFDNIDVRGIQKIIFSPNEKYVGTNSGSNFYIWDVKSEENITTLEIPNYITYNITPDFKRLIYADENNLIKIISIPNGESISTLESHKDMITSLNITPNGKYIVSSSYDLEGIVWDLAKGKVIYILDNFENLGNYNPISPDGKFIFDGNSSVIKIRELVSGKIYSKFKINTIDMGDVKFTSNSNYLLSNSRDNVIRLWDFQGIKTINLKLEIQKKLDTIEELIKKHDIIKAIFNLKEIIDNAQYKNFNNLLNIAHEN